MTDLALRPSGLEPVIDLVINSLVSKESRRAYANALVAFLNWWEAAGRPPLSKALANEYRSHLQEKRYAPTTINQHLSAIRKLVAEAADNGLIDPVSAERIARVKGVHSYGTRKGNWLSRSEVKALMALPDTSTLAGLRDRAIIDVLATAGLRRAEVVRLQFENLQRRDGRPIIIDLLGKGNRVRSVPIRTETRNSISLWSARAGIDSGAVFRPVNKSDRLNGPSMTPQAVYYILRKYAIQLDLDIAPHDLRRTFSKLAHSAGAPIDQIQLSLGHASVQTTERYLGIEQDLQDSPADYINLE